MTFDLGPGFDLNPYHREGKNEAEADYPFGPAAWLAAGWATGFFWSGQVGSGGGNAIVVQNNGHTLGIGSPVALVDYPVVCLRY